jgi:hypothetical protein
MIYRETFIKTERFCSAVLGQLVLVWWVMMKMKKKRGGGGNMKRGFSGLSYL